MINIISTTIKLLLFSIIFSSIGNWPAHGAAIQAKCPQKDFKELETILEKLVGFGKNQRAFPTNIDEAKKFCGQIKKDNYRIDTLLKSCLDKTAKNLMTILLYSFNASMKTYCNVKNRKKFNDFMQISKCVNQPSARGLIYDELEKYIDTMQRAKMIKPAKNGVGYACCDYYKLSNNLERKLATTCSEKQVGITIEFIRNLIQSLIDVGCGDYVDGSDTCDKLASLPKKNKNEKKYNSFILPLVDFWNQLD